MEGSKVKSFFQDFQEIWNVSQRQAMTDNLFKNVHISSDSDSLMQLSKNVSKVYTRV